MNAYEILHQSDGYAAFAAYQLARATPPLTRTACSALDRIEARVGDLGDSEASRCIREVCRELRALRVALERIRSFPVHSEPVGSAYAMQDIAHEALTPNRELSHGDQKGQL